MAKKPPTTHGVPVDEKIMCPACKKVLRSKNHLVSCATCNTTICVFCMERTGRCDWCEDAVTEDH